MRKLILTLILTPFFLFSQSTYPLGFTFDDNNWYVKETLFMTFNNDALQHFSVFLTNADDGLIFLDTHAFLSFCKDIKTLEELYNYKNIYKDNLSSKCYYMVDDFTDSNQTKTFIYGNMIMLVSKDYSDDSYLHYYKALIFEKDNYLGSISARLETKDKFYKILRSIKPNKDIKSIDEYIKDAKENLNNYLLNRAFKSIASAMLIDLNHKDILPLLKKIYEYREGMSFTKGTIEKLELLEQNRK
jgi:hypothetical protein